MAKQKINIDGTTVRIDKSGYVCLTDIAKRSTKTEPYVILRSWLKNKNTLEFLEAWEEKKNPNFKPTQMVWFKNEATKNDTTPSPIKYIEQTGAIGLTEKLQDLADQQHQ